MSQDSLRAVLAAAVLSSTACASDTETMVASGLGVRSDGVRITQSIFANVPTASEVRGVFPPAAKDAGISGRVTTSCRVAANGSLDYCVLRSENPTGLGFGAAAQRLIGSFRVRLTGPEPHPKPGDTVVVPVLFEAR